MNFNVYCDESCSEAKRYMVLGGILTPSTNVELINESMAKFRHEQNMHAELKWQKVSNQKLNEYRRFVDYFFALNNSNKLCFHALIIDTHQLDHARFNKGDKEVGFYKFFYQLLLHCFGRPYAVNHPSCTFHVKLDERTSSYSLGDLKTILNRGLASRYQITSNPFLTVEPMDSKKSEMLQINDIILGAVGFQKNGVDLIAGTRMAKIELAKHIAAKAGLSTLSLDTPFRQRRFTIWNFKLKK